MKVFRAFALLLLLAAIFLGALWFSTPDVTPLATTPPEDTAFMQLRRDEAAKAGKGLRIVHRWKPLASLGKNLQNAVIVSEDAAFYAHDGVDWDELEFSFRRNFKERTVARGGSTITQQLAKNLFLSPSKNPVRKLRELLIARELENTLSKKRILELYLNSIEWGDGIFGAEAAARHYFGEPAANLTAEQAALLAAIIPNPRHYGDQLNSRYVKKRQRTILRRMQARYGETDEALELRD